MRSWFVRGLTSGIRTTPFPRQRESKPGTSPGFPEPTHLGSPAMAITVAALCPTGALVAHAGRVDVEPRKCIHCLRCAREAQPRLNWRDGYDWAWVVRRPGAGPASALGRNFRKALNILVVDAGDCGACLNEVRQLNNLYYNMHRLGFFITPTPRNADLLLVVGPVTDAMRHPLLAAWEAMPDPKAVAAVGACALSGSVFGPSVSCGAGVREVLPVDVEVPGNPPPPLAILHALLLLTGRVAQPSEPTGGTP